MNLKKLVLAALLIGLSFIGASLKIFGTIAFDSLPAFLGALLLGPAYGAGIGFLGHLFTALLSGFPYGLLIHAVIAVSMALTMTGFALTYRLFKKSPLVGNIAAGIVGTLLNGPVALAVVFPFLAPDMGRAGVWSMLPILTVAGAANAVLALLVYHAVKGVARRTVEDR